MFKRYVVNGQVYKVSNEKEPKFLQEFPNAELIEDTVSTPTGTETATTEVFNTGPSQAQMVPESNGSINVMRREEDVDPQPSFLNSPPVTELEELSFNYTPEQDKELKNTLSEEDYRKYKSKAWRNEDKLQLEKLFERVGSAVPAHLRPAYEHWKTTGEEVERPFGGVKYVGGEIDPALIPEEERLEHDLDSEGNILSGTDKLKNVYKRWAPTSEMTTASSWNLLYNALENVAEANTMPQTVEERAKLGMEYITNAPLTMAKQAGNAIIDFFVDDDTFDEEKKINYNIILEKQKEIQNLGIGGGIIGSFDKKTATGAPSGDDFVAGVANSVMSVATSVVPAAIAGVTTTAVTRSPHAGAAASAAVMFQLITPTMVSEYNIEKANRLYPELKTEEERLAKLVEENKEEIGIPLGLGTIATGLEYVGFKGMASVIAKDLAKRGSKNLAKSMWGFVKRDSKGNINEAALRETGTEIAQLIPELTNEAAAKDLGWGEGLNYVWENFKEQAPEVAVQSFIGSRLFIGGTRKLMDASRIIREHSPTVEGVNANSFFTLGTLKQRRETDTYNSPEAKEGLDRAIAIEEQKITQAVKDGNKLAQKLDDNQVNQITEADSNIKRTEKQITDLEAEYELGLMQKATYKEALAGFNGYIDIQNDIINNIINDVSAESAKTIRKEDGSFTTQYDKELSQLEAMAEVRSSKKAAIDKFNKINNQLKKDFENKKITQAQYNADRAANLKEYNESKKKWETATANIQESVKGVKESSVKASKKLGELFNKGIKEGTITKGKDGKNIIGDKIYQEILKTQKPFIKKLANAIFNSIPSDKRIGKKSELESNIESIGLLDLLRTYDGKIPLGAYLQQQLPKRAISKSVLGDISNQQFKKDLESAEVQGMISEEDSTIDGEIKNIETAQDLGVSKNLMNTIKNAAKKALLTAKQGVDNLKFKGDIAKALKDALYNEVKKELGLKNTKKNKGLTKAIEKNPVAFYNSLSVESMRMARTKDGKNPFEEAGFLVRNKDGVLEKKKYSPKLGMDFLDYFVDPNLKASTRSDRQMNLVEALVTSMGAREAISLLENDIEFRQQFAEQQQKEKEKTIFQKAADKIQNVFQKITEKTSQEFATYDKEWPALLKERGIENFNLNDETQRKAFLEKLVTTGLTKLLPASFFRNFQGTSDPKIFIESDGLKYVKNLDGKLLLKSTYDAFSKAEKKEKGFGKIERQHARNVFFINTAEADAWIKEVGVENFAKEKDTYKAISKTKDSYTKIVNGKKVARDINDPAFVKDQDNKLTALEDIFTIFQDYMIEDGKLNKEKAAIVAGLLKSSSSWQEHFVRKLSPVKFTTSEKMFDSNGKRLFTEEHTLPASAVAKYLFTQATDGTVKDNFNLIKNNYFQGALLDVYDNKLNGIGPDGKPFNYKNRPPDGWALTDNIWARYFNINVNNNNGGIDPNTIILRNGKSVAQEFNVKPDGTITPDIKQLQQESIAEQTEDQVENLIDRAIAKLTELTGSRGTLQMNLATIPVQTIISALRTVKLAYQGGKLLAQAIDMGYNKIKDYMSAQEWADFVSKSTQEVRNQKNPADVKLAILSERGVAQMQEQSRKEDEKLLKEFGIEFEGLSADQIVEKLGILRKAKGEASNAKNPTKKARVFDFDDTLAKTDSKVLYTLPDGTKGNLDATQFAEQYNSLKEAGATFDYSEFNQVKKGSKGPLANLAKRFTEAVGDRDVFVLTARPAEAAEAIQEFLRSTLGISIPLKNITGLENGTPGAKAMWIAEKVSEGYNDIFFADDSKSNVDAVEKMLTDLGVTKRVQQAKEDGQKTLEDEMDSLVRTNKPSKLGRILNKFNIYIPPGADDFAGLLSYFVGSGKKGEQQQKWFKDNLLDPFGKGINAWTSAKVSLANDYKELKKRFKNKKLLAKKVLGGLYTNEQAVRAYLYDKAGQELGLNKADAQDLIALVEGNPELKAFADEVSKITKLENGYPNITKEWLGGNIDTDMANAANTSLRQMFLQDFINNKNQIFSEQNLKLIKQAYGNDFVNALENILERMTTGINRKKGKDKEFNTVMNWINQSVGAVMALNMRSAILQQLSIVNYANWSFNNPFMMAKAMANVPQFLQDYVKIWNSPFLQERRGRMSIEVNMEDIADSNPGNLFLRLNKKLLELGFKPTQWGDSNAISFGGASWYRNRVNRLIKEGATKEDAETQAMVELRELSEEHQQSSRPDRISRQQSSDIGRLILAFANTPLQLARSTKKAVGDLIYRRGDPKTNASKIIYYGMAQSIIFAGLQQGLFSLLMDDDDELDEKEKKKLEYGLHSVIDGLLRGVGFAGATVAALKNLAMEYSSQQEKRRAGEYVRDGSLKLIQRGLSISPPVSKKIGDIVEAQKFETWRQYKNDPFYQAFAYANYVSGLTNLPVDRVFKKIENLKAASDARTEAWQSIFLSLGWSPYNVGVQWPEMPPKKTKKPKNIKNIKKIKKIGPPNRLTPKKIKPLYKREVKILGKAHKDGTIEIASGLSPEKRRKVRAHEEQHGKDMRKVMPDGTRKLDYSKDWVKWNNNYYERTSDQKVVYNGKKYIEGHPKLPWEIAANKAESKVS